MQILLDTSAYIPLLRGDPFFAHSIGFEEAQLIASIVVIQELYMSGRSPKELSIFTQLAENFRDRDCLFTPTESHWLECGEILATIGQERGYEFIGRSRLTNDTLIALCCRDHRATLWTRNSKDFALLAEFIKFRWVGI